MVKRDRGIDTLRGLAICLMVSANMSALLEIPHPFLYRMVGSLAAPLFITLSGWMVARASVQKHPFSYYLHKAFLLLTVAAGVDLFIWFQIPFLSFDVLYLIASTLPIAALARGWRLPVLVSVIVGAIGLASFLQYWVGYSPLPDEIRLIQIRSYSIVSVVSQFFIDGWFPFFPWVAFSLFGVLLQKIQRHHFIFFWGIATTGIVLWILQMPVHYIRLNYSELFYPPDLSFCLSAFGVVGILAQSIPLVAEKIPILHLFGRASLAIYVVHQMLISYLLLPLVPPLPFPLFFGVWILMMGLMLWLSLGISKLKKGKQPSNPWLKMFLG